MSDTSPSLLVRAADLNDQEAWSQIVELYTPLIRGWLANYAFQSADVDDLVQDVLHAVYRNLPVFRHNRHIGAFRSWLRTIAVNQVRQTWRNGRFRPRLIGDLDFESVLEQLGRADSELSRRWEEEHNRYLVRRMLERLEPDFRPPTWRAFRRLMLEGAELQVVAAELGLSENAVLIAKSRVLQKLRAQIQDLLD